MHSSFIYYLLWNAKCLSPLKSWDNEKQSAYAILDYYISFPITGDDLNLVRQGSHLSSLYTKMTLWLTLKLYICITLSFFFTIFTKVGLGYITHAPSLVLPIYMIVVKVTCSQKMTNWYFLLNCFNLIKTIFNNYRTALRNALMLDRGKIKMVIVGQSFYIYTNMFFFSIYSL